MKRSLQRQGGFTLLEVLLVVGIVSILAGIVILAINPSKNLADARNAQRRVDVNTILNAVYQYSIDNNGSIPSSIQSTSTVICKTTGIPCNGMVDLGALQTNGKYLVAIPIDPTETGLNRTGYTINKDANNRLTVDAPNAENSAVISVTR